MTPTNLEPLPILQVLISSLWTENTIAGRVIIVAIATLTFVAWLSAKRHRKRYRLREDRSLGWVEHNLKTWRKEIEAKVEKETAGDAVDNPKGDLLDRPDPRGEMPLAEIPKLLQNVAEGSLIHQRIKAIEDMRHFHIKINVEALQQLSLNQEEAQLGLKLPQFIIGLSMMLGMLGTFIGLSAVVSDINLQLPDNVTDITIANWQHSIQNIRLVLGGMKTAFSTTLAGLVGALLASYWDLRLKHGRAKFFERLERFNTSELMAATIPTFEDQTLIQRVSRQLETSFTDVRELFERNSETVRELTAAEKGFLKVAEEMQNLNRHDTDKNLENVIAQLASTNAALLRVAEHLPRMTQSVEKCNQNLTIRLREITTEFQKTMSNGSRIPFNVPLAASLILLVGAVVWWLIS